MYTMVRNMFTISAFSVSFASMENRRFIGPLHLMMMLLIGTSLSVSFFEKATAEENLETYIVLLDKPQGLAFTESQDLDAWYQSFMPVGTSTLSENRLVHSYRHVVTGFAARLTAQEVKVMEEKKGFVSARPQRMLDLHTTHTPDLLGLFQNYGFWKSSNYGKGVIIGVVDTGIVPDHPSFSDDGMDPPPVKWKGECEFNTTSCNYKVIGARDFSHSGTPLDSFGHGTHTSSTAAGSPVQGANVLGQANGTAIGMAPLAHLAIYKVCGPHGCQDSDVLAAMDAAVEDGVDVLSLSLGGPSEPFYDDAIALGAFGAIQKGIFVSCAAGNSGPNSSSLSNEAPWILTVGASTVDREIRSTVSLGNNVEIIGQSLFQSDGFPSTSLPLVFAGANGNQSMAWCAPGSLKDIDVKGKIVLCEIGGLVPFVYKGQEVKDNGGAAMILMNDESFANATFAMRYALPTSHVGYIDGLVIKSYINSTSSPTGTISFDGTILGISKAPQVAVFSSRGPSQASPGILKPDIIGPGVSIVAAWPTTYDNSTNPTSAFNMVSGTSMSCPHLSGIAALLKASHPDWSPAAIKSAIMTTAHLSNLEGLPISDQQPVTATVFDMGSGHVNPSKANDPGLIYDTEPDDYIPYLCGLGYTSREVGVIVQRAVQCLNATSIPEAQLNYPSFSIKLGSNPQTYPRTVTNVGQADTVYRSIVYAPKGVDVKVSPEVIAFTRVNQKATYTITFSKNSYAFGSFAQGYLYWVASGYTVKSPFAVLFD